MEPCYNVLKKVVMSNETLCYISPKQRGKYKKYLGFAERFCKKFNIEDPNIFILNVPQSAIAPLMAFDENSEIFITTCEKIAKTLKSEHGITRNIVEKFMGIKPIPPKIRNTISLSSTPRIIVNNRKSDVAIKNQTLLSILDPPRIAILRDVMEKHNLDNEYSALMKIISKVRK